MIRIFALHFFLFFFQTIYAQIDTSTFIKGLSVEKDIMYEGAHGLRISYDFDFTKLNTTLQQDSLIKKSNFELVISLLLGDQPIKSTKNFKLLDNDKEEISIKKLLNSNIKTSLKGKEVLFVPYSALLLPVGQNTISCSLELEGHDGMGGKYNQKIKKNNIVISKKEQYLMTINIESLVADSLDFYGQFWDGGVFCRKCVAPDINVYIKLGQVILWDDWSKDSYRYFGDEKSRNITFYISKGDEVAFVVMDNDLLFHDYMGSIAIAPKEAELHHFISSPPSFGRINQCSLQWKTD